MPTSIVANRHVMRVVPTISTGGRCASVPMAATLVAMADRKMRPTSWVWGQQWCVFFCVCLCAVVCVFVCFGRSLGAEGGATARQPLAMSTTEPSHQHPATA